MSQELLKEAFSSFLDASKSLESYFFALQEKINYLTKELERTNIELKKSLDEKEKTKNFIETILNSLEEAIIALDKQKNIVMLNHGAEKLLDITGIHYINKPFSDLNIDIRKDGDTQYLKVKNKNIPVIYSEYPVKNKTKEERGKLIVIKDISKIKELENYYERNKRLIAMGEMAAKIVHEIRSPLCSIELFASMLKDEKSCKEKEGLVEGVISGISSLNNILNNMLYFAKERKVKGSDISLSSLIDGVIELFRPVLDKKQIKLIQQKQDIIIFGDLDLLKQAIFNILQNAYHAIEFNGTIKITSAKKDEYAVISIKDTGVGIKNEDLEKIFDPFFSTRDSGTGLGLAITLKIVEAHKGFIEVFSELGKGSEFKIYLPLVGGVNG